MKDQINILTKKLEEQQKTMDSLKKNMDNSTVINRNVINDSYDNSNISIAKILSSNKTNDEYNTGQIKSNNVENNDTGKIKSNNMENNEMTKLNKKYFNEFNTDYVRELTNEEKIIIFSGGDSCIYELIKIIHFNANYPKFHNVYINHVKDSYGYYFDGLRWSVLKRNMLVNVIYNCYNNHIKILLKNNEHIFNQIDTQNKINLIKFFELSNSDASYIKTIKNNIIYLLSNNNYMPKEIKRQLNVEIVELTRVKDAEKDNEEDLFLYFVHSENTSLYKIGRTSFLIDRIRALQTGNGIPLFFYKILKIPYNKYEVDAHDFFKNYGTVGEWFNLSKIQIDSYIESLKLTNTVTEIDVNPLNKYLKTIKEEIIIE